MSHHVEIILCHDVTTYDISWQHYCSRSHWFMYQPTYVAKLHVSTTLSDIANVQGLLSPRERCNTQFIQPPTILQVHLHNLTQSLTQSCSLTKLKTIPYIANMQDLLSPRENPATNNLASSSDNSLNGRCGHKWRTYGLVTMVTYVILVWCIQYMLTRQLDIQLNCRPNHYAGDCLMFKQTCVQLWPNQVLRSSCLKQWWL